MFSSVVKHPIIFKFLIWLSLASPFDWAVDKHMFWVEPQQVPQTTFKSFGKSDKVELHEYLWMG